jgi:two-component system sensor histidine kinase PilS (NtrC family)
VLLGGTAFVGWQLGGGADPALRPLYAVIAATNAASLGFAVLLRRARALVALAYAQIVLDTVLAATVVAITGYSDSVFVFMFSLGIVNGAILLSRGGAAAAGALSIAVYLGLCLAGDPSRPVPAGRLFAHATAFVATAALAAYLARLLSSAGERLAAKESEIEAITALHESVVQSLTSGLLTFDGSGRVTYLNRAGEAMTGLTLADLRGHPATRWFPEFEVTPRGELDWVNRRGERLRVGYSVFPLESAGSAGLGNAVIFQDLTRLREMEEAVRRSERLADLGGVAAALAHELRNPLASMAGSIELLGSSAALAGEDRRLLDIVLREAARLDHLVGEFLAFARPPPLRRERVDLAEVAGETLSVYAHDPAAARLTVERELAPAPADCDAGQLRQVLWNLLSNAAQAIAGAPLEGTGRVRVACGPSPGGGAWLEVSDDGPGIAPADLGKIFLPFFTTKQDGTGLGLATVHRIVDAHGGRLSVDSAPGRGARFRVHLPGQAPGAALRRDVG